MAGIGHRGFMGRKKQVSPVPLSNLSFWYEFDNASKITEDGTNIQEILSSETNAWSAVPLTNDPIYSAAGGYAQFNFGSSQGMQSEQMIAAGYPISIDVITSGFMMMVVELDDLTEGRWLSGISYSTSNTPGSSSANLYGNFFGFNSGGFKLRYRGRMTMSDETILNIDGTTALTTGRKYLIQLYVPDMGGTYFEIDGVAQGNDASGNRFCGIVDSVQAWKVDMGLVQGISPIYAGSHKVYEFISYQAYDAAKYAQVETYLKTKYGIA